MDFEILQKVAMTKDEYDRLVSMLNREPNELEIGIVGALWSEHCGYKHSRPLFHNFPTEGEKILTKTGEENAGAIDLGDGWCAVFKMESHNHPSAIEPYQGAATGVGGILRDIFAMGMRPVALLDSLRFGPLSERNNRYLFNGVVSGIGGYGNCVGVPTVGGEVQFDKSYSGNPLVNAMCVGIGRVENLLSASASGPGNPLVLVGADTGRDGIHGATFASVELDENAEEMRPAVQVGNPFLEKLLLEACVELAEEHNDWIVGLQDLGAAGLTSSAIEAASRAGTGIDIDVTLVPRREERMTPYEVMLSESQERMLVIPKREHLDDVVRLFRRWEIRADVIGYVTDDEYVTIHEGQEIVARMPVAIPTDPPMYSPATMRPLELDALHNQDFNIIPDVQNPEIELLNLLGNSNITSRGMIYRQYDHQVLNNTVVLPGGDAAVLRIKGLKQGIAVTTDCNARLVSLEPRVGSSIAVAEAARNIVATGARPVAVTDCLNFGNPEKPSVAYQLEQAVLGISDACRKLGTPVVSGNASLYNETPVGQILPTPSIGMLGVSDSSADSLTIAPKENNTLILVGADFIQSIDTLSGSEYVTQKLGFPAGKPFIDLDYEVKVQKFVLDAHKANLLTAAHDCSEGGVAVALAEMALASSLGLDAKQIDCGSRVDASLFGESQSRFIIATDSQESLSFLEKMLQDSDISFSVIGLVHGERFRLGPIDLSISEMREEYEEGLYKLLGS
ncbi:MAG: phosphoribosylformylglycinamidine synthase subunit PurL [Dehalococcoidia bacterium]|nr:phosphoribosylformylglycinamidine synthase subunit PurL [Dehalococcoidia bacterium]